MLKYHEDDDIIHVATCQLDDTTDADITATVVGATFQPGETIRLIVPTLSVDNRVKVLRYERDISANGHFTNLDGQFVD